MTDRISPAALSRIEMIEHLVDDATLTDAQRWHLHNALINLARDSESTGRIAGRQEGAAKALAYALAATGRIPPVGRMEDMPAVEAFGWGKALAETAIIMIGEQIELGTLSLALHADTAKAEFKPGLTAPPAAAVQPPIVKSKQREDV